LTGLFTLLLTEQCLFGAIYEKSFTI